MHNDADAITEPIRPPQDNIPQARQQRDRLLQVTREYIEWEKPVGQLSLDELQRHSEKILETAKLSREYIDFTVILLNNELWRDTVAGIPFHKRLLLLPKCLRNQDKCRGTFDEFGLICEHCGSCIIDEFKSQAEQRGYAVLIAEGSPVVMSLIETGKIEAVVGVSCMSVLERVFPYMEAGAVPGVAIPLLNDGCANTSVDTDWVWDAINISRDDQAGRVNLEELRTQVNGWFSKESLEAFFAPCEPHSSEGLGEESTERLALEWMAREGKRWRPFLAVCAYKALAKDKTQTPVPASPGRQPQVQALPQNLRSAAIAVECFHKASLIHDDIEDGDLERYNQKTLHVEYGVPIALNVGDFLVGEGYRLLAQLEIASDLKVVVIEAAVQGHRSLCLGQGNELAWTHQPKPLSVAEVIDIFRKKTAPAFEVALKIGAILTGRFDDELSKSLEQYSQALGIAYQIRDDLEDFYLAPASPDASRGSGSASQFSVPAVTRPSFLLALSYEKAKEADKALLESVWNGSVKLCAVKKELEDVLTKLQIEQLALELLELYKSQAINSLILLKDANLKNLMRRVAGKIFKDTEIMGCCNDYTAGHAQSSESSSASAE